MFNLYDHHIAFTGFLSCVYLHMTSKVQIKPEPRHNIYIYMVFPNKDYVAFKDISINYKDYINMDTPIDHYYI